MQQINTFVIDFDRLTGEKLDSQMILDAAIDLELMPTLILETPGASKHTLFLKMPGIFRPKIIISQSKWPNEYLRT